MKIKTIQNPASTLGRKISLAIATLFTVPTLLFANSTPAGQAGGKSGRLNNDAAAGKLPVFTDVTSAAGLSTNGYTFASPIWGDYDNDGNLDLFIDNHLHRCHLYHNNGNGSFTDMQAESGIIKAGDRHGSAWADFDNDGYLDLSSCYGAQGGHGLGTKQDLLYQNLHNGTFVNVAVQAGVINTFGRARGPAWADYDRDGYIDLLDANLQTDLVLYRNNGDGTFTDVTAQAGLAHLQYIEVAFADYNNDGLPDIFLTCSQRGTPPPDVLYKNNGDGTFTNVSAQAGILPLVNGRGIAWADYDNDGNLDLFISRGTDEDALKQTLYHNNGDGTFTEVTDSAGLGELNNNRAAMWGDFDNDGYLDLYVTNSGSDSETSKPPNHLYHNNHDGTFTDVASRVGVDDTTVLTRSRGASWADYDKDGFLDLFVTNGDPDSNLYESGPQFLYHNGKNRNHWLEIQLVGTTSNRQGLGTKVTLHVGTRIQYREKNAGGGGHFLGQGDGPLHFGLGTATIVNQITVLWPSGLSQTLTNVAADQPLTITEGQ